MRRSLRLFQLGCIALALAVVALNGVTAFAQRADAESPPSGPPAQDEQAPANLPPVAFQLGALVQAGGQDLESLLVEKRKSFRTLLISELRFCRSACDLTEEQSQRMALRAGVMLEPAVVAAAKAQLRAARKGGIRLATLRAHPNTVEVVREVLQKLVDDQATPVQQGRYQAENKKRAAHRRETAIHGLVARLDRTLILSSGQREGLLKMFDSNWNDEWGVLGSVLGDDDAPLPAIPDRLVVPCLSATQQRLWRKLDRQAIDATDAYVAGVAEIMEGLPSEFTANLEAAARQAQKPPAAEVKQEISKKRAK